MTRDANAQITIRAAGPGDLDVVDAVEAASFDADRFPRRNLARLLASPSTETVLAECEGAPAGYVLLLFRKGAKAARLYSLATTPGARGKGVAAKLVHAALGRAIKRGCDRLLLEVRLSNAAAARVYERAGFLKLEVMPAYYDDGEDALRMELRLAAGRRGAR
jgi:ribosomal protein S18 acetylase RimI-like enzyme